MSEAIRLAALFAFTAFVMVVLHNEWNTPSDGGDRWFE